VQSAFAEEPEPSQPIGRVHTKEKVIALTFDDGPDDNWEAFARLFTERDVKATFFVIGKKVEKNPDAVKAFHEAGMEIGNHSYSHRDMSTLTIEEVKRETLQTQALVEKATGEAPKLYRAPFLKYSPEILSMLDEMQLPAVNAEVLTGDWQKEMTAERIFKRATTDIQSGDILLMHSWSGKTLEVMPRILDALEAQGFRFVTVSELMQIVGEK
jgi:peptidoglycan/xylan/chitin deacetylase (PgdA/CDA1 family)